MKRVYSSPLITIVENVKNVLELHGIRCIVRNQHLSTALGEIPPIECWPQLWVAEEDAERASQIIDTSFADNVSPQGNWICQKCKEKLEAQFTECWNCGTTRHKQ